MTANSGSRKIDNRPQVAIGFLIDAEESREIRRHLQRLQDTICRDLEQDFPEFTWSFRLIQRRDFPRDRPLDPLVLLEFGSELKIEYRLDFLLVLTSMPLMARFDQTVNGVPSNMLETGVVSLARPLENLDPERVDRAILALCRHLLGHLWGLDHDEHSVMRPRESWTGDGPLDWSPEEKEQVRTYLKDIADPRLEETGQAASTAWRFYGQLLRREGLSLARDILLFRSWRMVLHLGRFTAATAVSIIFLFLSAEAWELGAAIRSSWLDLILAAVLLMATLSIYFGQNLQEVGRADRMAEQAARSRIVLFGTLFVGMASFWINLFLISLGIIFVLPENVLAGWAGLGGQPLPMVHFSKLMATFGILASSLGGNLEEEHNLKAVLIYTEET
ncbi:MAG TPA: hypothetical protein ENI89_05805 [Desulfobulbus sp.]|nr:hypothetical protein [Desulfobulbus sp.]